MKNIVHIDADADEESRMLNLHLEYEKDLFPENKISEYKYTNEVPCGKLAYCYENECIYLPETEL